MNASLHLHDTLSGSLRPIVPADGQCLGFYCCGPTVYGPAHIGNFRTFVIHDVFRRVVELQGTKVRHVRNITDVDDKTIREAGEAGEPLQDFTRRWAERFHADARALNLLPPHEEPSAVAHIPQQIAMIEKLIEAGHAYAADDGSVYFRIASFPDYGKLSRLDQRELAAGHGCATLDADEYEKDHISDFVLWKARKPADADNYWESPWGDGRPGWHIECSAMSRQYLGDTFDVHSGGIDLCFPHHENEIAQSEGATGKPFARHWFHVTHLMVENQKMSKSLGNLYTLADLAEKGYTAAEMRYVLISGHYRKPLNFTFGGLQAARQALGRLAEEARALADAAGNPQPPAYHELLASALDSREPFQAAWDAINDNLNTPKALGELFSALNRLDKNLLDGAAVTAAHRELHRIVAALGLTLPTIESTEAPPEIVALANHRLEARRTKNWAQADELRDQINAAGWNVKDSKDNFELTALR